jgi:hypothetical protein
MINRSHENSVALALAVTTPCLAGLWMISVPQTPSTSTTAMALLVALVGTAIALYRSGEGTGSMEQLRAVEIAPFSAGSRPVSGSAARSGS